LYFGGSPSFKDIQLLSPVADFILASTPGGFDGVLQNNTPVVTECEIHWVVQLVNATVTSGFLTEEIMDTLEFEKGDPNNPWWPWESWNSGTWLANYSMTLDDPHSFTGGKSTFGFNNITAKKVRSC